MVPLKDTPSAPLQTFQNAHAPPNRHHVANIQHPTSLNKKIGVKVQKFMPAVYLGVTKKNLLFVPDVLNHSSEI